MISKTLSTSVCYARLFEACPELAEFAQALYPLLVAHADDFGREQGDVATVKYRIHPRSPRSETEFATALQALHDVGLITWYEAKGRRCYQITRFDEHQTGLHKRTRSQFPAVPGSSGNFPESPGQLKRTEEKGTKQNRTKRKSDPGAADAPPSRAHALLAYFDSKHREKTGHPLVERPKDLAQLAELLDSHGQEVAGALVDAFFASQDRFIAAAGYTVGVFHSQAGRLVAALGRTERRSALFATDWRDECRHLHGGRCGNRTFHDAEMQAHAEAV